MKHRKSTNRVIFHHSLSPDVSAETIKKWHLKRNFADIGYHYVIRKNGIIETGRKDIYIGAHAKGKNYDSVGVCITGDFRKDNPSHFQVESCAALYFSLCKQYKKRLHIEYHRNEDEGNMCPGVFLNKVDFEKKLNDAYERGMKMGENYDILKRKLDVIAKSEPVQGLKKDVIADILDASKSVIQEYRPNLNKKAGKKGGMDAVIASGVAVAVTGAVKGVTTDLTPDVENLIAGLTGMVVSAIVAYVRVRIRNWKKHN